jgi:hypothetical protein
MSASNWDQIFISLDSTDVWRAAAQAGLRSDLVPREEVVLLPAGAVGALQATDKQHSHCHRYQDSQNVRVDHEPVKDTIHPSLPSIADYRQLCPAILGESCI